MHYKIGVTCVFNEHEVYAMLYQHDNIINLFHNSADRVIHAIVSGQCSYVILFTNIDLKLRNTLQLTKALQTRYYMCIHWTWGV